MVFMHTHTCLFTHAHHSRDHIEVVAVKNEMLFFKQRDGPYMPTLRLLHKCESFFRVH